MEGIFTRVTRRGRGFGFITPEDGGADWYVAAGMGKGAMTGDAVAYRALFESREGERREAEVTQVLARNTARLVGTYERERDGGRVVADKPYGVAVIPRDRAMNAQDGHKVVAEIYKHPGKDNEPPHAAITKILGHINDPGTDILSIVERLEMPYVFPEEAVAQANGVADEVTEADLIGRRDLRGWLTVTIDGADAKDLDDAVSLTKTDTGWQLGVHIADVAHYVKPGTPLYAEAYNRGTSAYLADRVIPMLPHKLSNGICSLNPNRDRLTLSCVMDVDHDGRVARADVFEGVINTARRMTYDDVDKIIGDPRDPLRNHYADVTEMLDEMNRLRQILWRRRLQRGAIEFTSAECKISVNQDGKPLKIESRRRTDATNLIEEFMLLCNETIAERFFWAGQPFVYRTHEPPNAAKLAELGAFTARFGYTLRPKTFARDVQKLFAAAAGKPEEALMNRVVLRSMKQARYTAEAIGHFGLAAKYYCHFTSPIRRFPDLRIHTIIKDCLAGRQTAEKIDQAAQALPEECARCSHTERRAEQAEREAEQMKKAEYMMGKIGQTFSGVISGVAEWGVYVELPNTVEGMVPRGDLYGDQFMYDRDAMCFRGRRTGREYRLGMKARVVVEKADKQAGRVTFSFA